MNIMGIDPSLTNFAIVGFNNEGVTQELIKSKLKGPERLIQIRDALIEEMEKLEPDYVGIEGYGFNSQRGVVLGELGGVIRVVLYEYFGSDYDKKVIVIPPTTLKKFVSGKGNCEKSLILKNVFKRWGYDCDNDNLADAYSIAKYVEDQIKNPKV